MLRIFKPLLLIATVVTFSSCAHKVTRVDPNAQIDLSGRWNNTDSRLVSEEMTGRIINADWRASHQQEKGRKPVVIIGTIYNKSHEHIEAETFTKEIEQEFLRSDKVGLVQGGQKREELRAEKADQQTNASQSTMKKFGLEKGADYILTGSINSIVDSQKRKKEVYYQVDLELTNIETNEVVWIGDKKIAKYIKN
jgi:penicillin-binding protein activator